MFRRPCSCREILRAERFRQKLGKSEAAADLAFLVADMDYEARRGELAQFLTAAATRRHQRIARAHDGSFGDPPAPTHDHGGYGTRLRARAFRICGILDIAACMHRP